MLMLSENNNSSECKDALPASELVARLTSIDIEGMLQEPGRGDRFVVVSIDDREKWKSKKCSHGSRLHWQTDHRLWLHPSSSIKFEIFRSSILSKMLADKRYLLGQFSGKVVELLGNSTAFDLKDITGAHLPNVKIKVQVTLVSNSPQDIMDRVDAAISRLDNGLFFKISSEDIDASVTVVKATYSSTEMASSCIPSLRQAFEAVMKISRAFSDTHPILKVACTVIFSVYEAWKNELLQDTSLKELAESLREMVCTAHECPDISAIEGTEDVIEAIGRVAMEIASLIDEYAKRTFVVRSVRDALSSDMKTRLDLFQARCRDLREKFNTRIIIGTHKMLKDRKLAERHKEILQWLNAPDPSRNYNTAREKHREGTGSWFLAGSEFTSWKSRPGSLLWVEGIPGCGKTVLCSSVIKDIEHHCATDRSAAFAYFFFDSRDAQEGLQRHEGLIRSLIKQFTLQCTTMPDTLEKLYGVGQSQPSLRALHDTLRLIIGLFKDAFVIIDSLDECPSKARACEERSEREKVRSWIKEINDRDEFGHIHLLVTSRDERDIRQALQSLSAIDVPIDGESVNEDIRQFLDDKLRTDEELKRWKDKSEEIQARVLSMSKGMFRLAALQLEELRDCHNLRELTKQMSNLPRTLYDTYDRILSKLSEKHRDTALMFLQWLAFSARPPRLKELAEVVCVDFEADPHPRFSPDLRYNTESVLTVCSSLIVTSTEGEIKLAHMSVKEYLLSSSARQFYGYDINEKMSHSLIAQTCIAYLVQFDTVDVLHERSLEDLPLAQYAAEHWVYHAKSAADTGTGALQALIDTLFSCNSDGPFISWIQLHDLDTPWEEVDMKRSPYGSRLYYASLAGLPEALLTLLKGGANPNAKGGRYGSALQAAVYNGDKQVVRLLLEKGADVNLPGGYFWSALQAAAYVGHEQVVQLLLEKGAEVNMKGGDFGSALQAAAFQHHEQVVRMLLDKGADVNLKSGHCGSALQAAAVYGQEQLVGLRLEKGADVKLHGEHPESALQAARYNGHEKVIRLLLEMGADVNLRGGDFGSALQAAAVHGHEQVVRLLLEKGADVNLQGGHHGSALQAAVVHDYANIVRLLLENGADPNAMGRRGSILRMAHRHQSVITLLLEYGAEWVDGEQDSLYIEGGWQESNR